MKILLDIGRRRFVSTGFVVHRKLRLRCSRRAPHSTLREEGLQLRRDRGLTVQFIHRREQVRSAARSRDQKWQDGLRCPASIGTSSRGASSAGQRLMRIGAAACGSDSSRRVWLSGPARRLVRMMRCRFSVGSGSGIARRGERERPGYRGGAAARTGCAWRRPPDLAELRRRRSAIMIHHRRDRAR